MKPTWAELSDAERKLISAIDLLGHIIDARTKKPVDLCQLWADMRQYFEERYSPEWVATHVPCKEFH